MEWSGWMLLGTLVCLGCQQVLGLEEGRPSTVGGGGATAGPVTTTAAGGMGAGPGSGGSGAAGGATTSTGGSGGTGLPLPDWTDYLTASYRFEPTALAADSRGLYPLTNIGGVANTADKVEGDGSAQLTGSTGFEFLDVEPFGASPSLTIGGWFSIDAGTAQTVASRADATSGYRILFGSGNQSALCRVRNGQFNTEAEVQPWAPNVWTHVTCIFEPTRVTVVTETVTAAVAVTSWPHAATAQFRLGFVDGNIDVDELFFHTSALAEPTIHRIRQCRIDGSACQCDPNNPSAYLSCGGSPCNLLPACDQATPN